MYVLLFIPHPTHNPHPSLPNSSPDFTFTEILDLTGFSHLFDLINGRILNLVTKVRSNFIEAHGNVVHSYNVSFIFFQNSYLLRVDNFIYLPLVYVYVNIDL